MGGTEQMESLSALIRARYSCRSFQDLPVPRPELQEIMEIASAAPSGGNIQPWGVKVLTGAFLKSFSALAHSESERNPDLRRQPNRFYADDLRDPYAVRRRETGYALYNALGIERTDYDRRASQMMENFSFFGATAGIIIHTDMGMVRNQWLDLGGFVQTVCLAATEKGLATCIQGIWSMFNRKGDPVKRALGLDDDRWLVCGIALGHPDARAAVNTFRTSRVAPAEFVEYLDQPDAPT